MHGALDFKAHGLHGLHVSHCFTCSMEALDTWTPISAFPGHLTPDTAGGGTQDLTALAGLKLQDLFDPDFIASGVNMG